MSLKSRLLRAPLRPSDALQRLIWFLKTRTLPAGRECTKNTKLLAERERREHQSKRAGNGSRPLETVRSKGRTPDTVYLVWQMPAPLRDRRHSKRTFRRRSGVQLSGGDSNGGCAGVAESHRSPSRCRRR
jgi:hypothetical protein